MSNSMSGWLALVAGIIGAVGAISGIAGYEAYRADRCNMAAVHVFAMEACSTGKGGTLCVLTPSDIVKLRESAETLKACVRELEK